MDKPVKKEDYRSLLNDIKSILNKGLTKAYKAVDNLKVQTYWQIGERIVREELSHKERADYGVKLIESLAVDLGFSRDELYRIVQFHKVYPIVVTVSQQLSWSHYVELIKIRNKEEMKFYEMECVSERWNIRELRRQINSALFQRIALSKDKKGLLEMARKGHMIKNIEHSLKAMYVLKKIGVEV